MTKHMAVHTEHLLPHVILRFSEDSCHCLIIYLSSLLALGMSLFTNYKNSRKMLRPQNRLCYKDIGLSSRALFREWNQVSGRSNIWGCKALKNQSRFKEKSVFLDKQLYHSFFSAFLLHSSTPDFTDLAQMTSRDKLAAIDPDLNKQGKVDQTTWMR